jgi:hypothetical protein
MPNYKNSLQVIKVRNTHPNPTPAEGQQPEFIDPKNVGLYLDGKRVDFSDLTPKKTHTKSERFGGKLVEYFRVEFEDTEKNAYSFSIGKADDLVTLAKTGVVYTFSPILDFIFCALFCQNNSQPMCLDAFASKKEGKYKPHDNGGGFYYTVLFFPLCIANGTKEEKEAYRAEQKQFAATLPTVTATKRKGKEEYTLNIDELDAFYLAVKELFLGVCKTPIPTTTPPEPETQEDFLGDLP